LATQPELLLLYEPVTGMNVEEIETMLAMITALRKQSSSVKMLSETLKNWLPIFQ
jgi:ABC-type branched-subunit amino acid transport system ATPase component